MKVELLRAMWDNRLWAMPADELRSMVAVSRQLTAESVNGLDGESKPIFVAQDGYNELHIDGPIVRRHNWFSEWIGAVSTEQVLEAIGQADRSGLPTVAHIASPGGEAAAVGEAADAFAELDAPLITYTNSYAQSGGFWWYAQGDLHLAHAGALLGCVGVRCTWYDEDADAVIVSENAERKLGDRNEAQDLINGIEAVMLQSIAAGYGVDVDTVKRDFGRGATFVAEKAQQRGMVDRLTNRAGITQEAGDLMNLSKTQLDAIAAAGGIDALLAQAGAKETGTANTTETGTATGAASAAAGAPPEGYISAADAQRMIAESNRRQLAIMGHPGAEIDRGLALELAGDAAITVERAVSILDRLADNAKAGRLRSGGGEAGYTRTTAKTDGELDALETAGHDYDDGTDPGAKGAKDVKASAQAAGARMTQRYAKNVVAINRS